MPKNIKMVVRYIKLLDTGRGRMNTLLRVKPRRNVQSARPSLACKIIAFLFSLQNRSQAVKKKSRKKRDKNLFAPITNELL
jgi:hypothetical protein